MKEPLYVCVHVPEFASQALLRLRPNLAHSPVAVLAGDPPLEQVCSANVQALLLGITHAMTRAELDSFSGITLLRRSESEESAARAALLELAGGFTPRVEIRACSAASFTMVLDMTGTSLIFGPVPRAITRIADALSALHFAAKIAASANFHTAVCMAPSAGDVPVIVPAGAEKKYLSSLPLSSLNLTIQQSDTFQMWGLHSLGELAALPEVDLVVRLGQEGKRLRLLARGEHVHLMQPEEPVFTLQELVSFDAPVELMESLLFVLGPMLDQLLTRAQNRSFALASVTVKLGLDGGGEHERTIKPALPVLQREVLLKLLHLDLQIHPPPAGVVHIFLHAEPGDRSKVQLGLFAPQLPESLRLDVTIARLSALVGDKRVGRARLRDTHCPDSFVMEPFVVPVSSSKEAGAGHSIALRRYRPPLKLSVAHKDQRLHSFFFHGRRYTVQQAYGPWRRSGDWWSPVIWSHEEWDIRASAPGSNQAEETLLCLVTHDLLSRHWHLEALYD